MALIARAAFQNEVVRTVASTRTYSLPATKKNPSGLTVTMGHKMLDPNDSRYYEGIIGGKTGYTSKAGNTLVTAAERNGVRMIAVVMKSRSTHYVDTKAMLDYGFELAKAGALETNQTGGQNAGSSQTGAGSGGPGAGAGPSGAAGAPESTGASGVTVVPGNTGAPQNPGSTGVPVTGTEGGPGVSSQHGWAKRKKDGILSRITEQKPVGNGFLMQKEPIGSMKIHLWQKAGARLMESGTICVPTVLWQKTTGKKARMEFGTIWEQTV